MINNNKLKISIILLIIFFIFLCIFLVNITVPKQNVNQNIQNTNTLENVQTGSFIKQVSNLDCYFYIPENVQKNTPLVIFLHGVSEHNIEQVMQLKPVQSITDGTIEDIEDFIFVAPAAPKGTNWASSKNWDKVIDLVNTIAIEYYIDMNRLYLTGFSAGGNAVWGIINKYPNTFRAAIPVSGNVKITPSNFTNTAIYAIVGEYETRYKMPMNNLVKSINKAGGSASMNIIPKAGHSETQRQYTTKELYVWLLSQ